MSYQVIRLLNHAETAQIVSSLAGRNFADGKPTAQGRAREVKHNLQLDRAGSQQTDLDQIVSSALQRSAEFQRFVIPKRLIPPIISRYDPGMQYGSHVDSAIMGGLNAIRTDFAITLFLSPPASYEGGELVITMPAGQEEIKLDAGEAIVYPASTIHRVAPVTSGARLAAVTWVQSAVHDERLRAMLYDLSSVAKRVEDFNDRELSLQLSKSYQDLLRYAAEP